MGPLRLDILRRGVKILVRMLIDSVYKLVFHRREQVIWTFIR